MIVWRTWVNVTTKKDLFGNTTTTNHVVYKLLLLFGFIPLFIAIDGKKK